MLMNFISTMWSFMKSLFNLYQTIPHDITDIIKTMVQQTVVISNIAWINNLLYMVCSLIAFAVSLVLVSKSKKMLIIEPILSIVIFVLCVWLFSKTWFWIIILIAIIYLFVCFIINLKKERR